MPRMLPTIIAAALATIPASLAVSGALHAATPTATPKPKGATHARPTSTPIAKKRGASRPRVVTRTITGPGVDMDWGTVQVTIILKGKTLVNVQATAPMERARSNFINSQAIPWLRQEALKAQNANIDLIGGATMTSEAFAQSLQAALTSAHL